MKPHIYVRILLTVPEAGSVIHIAELEEIDAQSATMLRIVELDPNEQVTGAAQGTEVHNMAAPPMQTVPHPDFYEAYPDISARRIEAVEFEKIWNKARDLFPSLT